MFFFFSESWGFPLCSFFFSLIMTEALPTTRDFLLWISVVNIVISERGEKLNNTYSPKMITRDSRTFLDSKVSQNLISFQCSTSCIRRAWHLSMKQNWARPAGFYLDFFKCHFGGKSCEMDRCIKLHLFLNNCPERQENGSESVKNALYSLYRLGSIAYLKLWKRIVLPLFLQSLSLVFVLIASIL